MDVREGSLVAGFFDHVVSDLGSVDILVNNAGGGFWSPFAEVSENGEMITFIFVHGMMGFMLTGMRK